MDVVVDKLLTIQTRLGMEPSYRGTDIQNCGAYAVHELLDKIEAHVYGSEFMRQGREKLLDRNENTYTIQCNIEITPGTKIGIGLANSIVKEIDDDSQLKDLKAVAENEETQLQIGDKITMVNGKGLVTMFGAKVEAEMALSALLNQEILNAPPGMRFAIRKKWKPKTPLTSITFKRQETNESIPRPFNA